jgi:hypothetical protein
MDPFVIHSSGIITMGAIFAVAQVKMCGFNKTNSLFHWKSQLCPKTKHAKNHIFFPFKKKNHSILQHELEFIFS